ncbi:MAG: leucine-rich repeat protein, partial [Lachnospiraceae bacterium]|nr:leucine-rich repeat protein [Lachnospiraceae bacterium]
PFKGCTNLKKVSFEQGMKTIPMFMLNECYVEEVIIPDSVTTIDDAAFWYCSNLKKVSMPDSVTLIGADAFLGCRSLETIHLSKSLQKIEMNAFKNCTSLNNITIPKSLTYAIGVFTGCSSMTNVTFEDGIQTVVSNLFSGCTGLKSITLPEGMVGIGSYAFQNCSALETIYMPDSVTWIGDRALYNCVSLKEVELSSNLQTMGSETFGNCSSLASVNIPKSLTSVKTGISHPFIGCSSLKTATFEEGTKVVIKNLFENCGSLETVVFPESVTEIHDNAFGGCSSLKNIELPSQMTYIAQKAFYCCTALEKIELPSTLAYVFPDCFYGCSALKEITIPAGITGIGARAFHKCTALEKVTFEKNGVISAIEDHAFADCSALTSFTVPNTVEKLGMGTFATCASLTEVNLGTGVKVIPSYLLDNSPELQSVVIPYQVTQIESGAFARSPKLKKVTIPANVTSIASDIFSYPGEVTIYGVEGSYAQTYANANGIRFVAQTVPATEISIETEQMELNVGATKVITHNVLPVDFTDTLIWSSSDEKVATVEAGKVTGVKSGTVTITVKSKENSNLKATCKVKVVQPVTKIELSATNKTLNAADTFDLNPKVSPDNAYNKKLHFYSENESIATVSEDGVVTARLQGTTKIYASSTDGSDVKTYCRVEVKGWAYWIENPENLESAHPYYNGQNDLFIYEDPKAEKLRLTFSKDTFVEDGKDTISVLNGNNKVIGTYTGSELAGKVVEVPGSAVRIKLVTDRENVFYGFKVDKLEVVEKTVQLKSISLNESDISLKKGAQSKLEVIYNPENTNVDKTITWSSDNEAVATVKEDGTVVAVASGIATITAKVKDKKATCKVYVWEGVTKVTFEAGKNTLYVGERSFINYSVSPLQATIKEVAVSNSDKNVASVELLRALNKVEIIPLKEGKTTITVNADGVRATYDIVVSNKLSLDYQDGTGKVESVSVTYNKPLSVLESKVPVRNGYYFVGWYTGKNGAGEAVNAETVLTTQRTLYAFWQKI